MNSHQRGAGAALGYGTRLLELDKVTPEQRAAAVRTVRTQDDAGLLLTMLGLDQEDPR